MYVYPIEFESKGILASAVSTYSTFALFLFQIMMFGLFSTIFGKEFIIASVILIIGEIISLIMFKILNVSNLNNYFNDDYDDDDEGLDFDATEKFIKVPSKLKSEEKLEASD